MGEQSGLSRRTLLKSTALSGLSLACASPAIATLDLPDPDDVLADISVRNYVQSELSRTLRYGRRTALGSKEGLDSHR